MIKGIIYALSACFIWGLIFIIPKFMSNYSAIEIALGRYWFYGCISFVFLISARLRGGAVYTSHVWIRAFFLSLLSGYYLWVILGMRYTSPEICALILGTSPITIAFYGDWKENEGNFKLLLFPSFLILVGLMMINAPHILITKSLWEYTIGLICSVIALASWSVYVVLNARFLKRNPHINSNDWATMQGVATFIWTVLCTVICFFLFGEDTSIQKYTNWSYETFCFFAGCATLGLACSWGGAALWNKASVFLSVSLAGQLMIFETIFGILFVYTLNQQFPPLLEGSGVMLLIGAVIYGIRNLKSSSEVNYKKAQDLA